MVRADQPCVRKRTRRREVFERELEDGGEDGGGGEGAGAVVVE